MTSSGQTGPWAGWLAGELEAIKDSGRWRSIRSFDGPGPAFSRPDGRTVTSFASNDYLGLSSHPDVVAAARAAIDRWGTGAGSARLIVGGRPVHDELEAALADWRGADAALLTSTGYMANLSLLSTLGRGARIVSDELNHASIIDGARLARAQVAVYRHADVAHAAQLVEGAPGRVLVVSDTVFSMDGDVAPIDELAAVCDRTGALLVLDDAHAVFGAPPVPPGVAHLRVGTLSKMFGSLGGYITGPRRYVDLLINRARPFIFTTAPTPPDMAAALAALTLYRGAEGASRLGELRSRIDQMRPGHPSPILPVVLGGEEVAVRAAAMLLERGLLVPAIRPPTVPPGSSRLRIALSAAHTAEQVSSLVEALDALVMSPR